MKKEGTGLTFRFIGVKSRGQACKGQPVSWEAVGSVDWAISSIDGLLSLFWIVGLTFLVGLLCGNYVSLKFWLRPQIDGHFVPMEREIKDMWMNFNYFLWIQFLLVVKYELKVRGISEIEKFLPSYFYEIFGPDCSA